MLWLSDRIKYRREGFGAIVLHLDTKETRFFNLAAAQLLETCRIGATLDEVLGCIPGEIAHVTRFVDDLLAQRILSTTGTPRTEGMFFTDITAFPESHLYSPLGVEIEVTLKCYRRCTYCCYESHPSVDTGSELTLEEWKAILAQLWEAGVFYIRFTGGDPFARRDFVDLLDFADSLDLIISVGSDLTILNEVHVERLARCRNLLMVQTTLDGSTAAIADEHRGAGNWARVVHGLETLRRREIPVVVGTVLRRNNVHDIKAIAALVGGYGAKGYSIAPLYSAGRGRQMEELIPTNDDLEIANRYFREAVAEGLVQPLDPAWPELASRWTPGERDRMFDDQPYLVGVPDRLLRIDPTGRCYTSVQVKELIGDSVFVGSIRHASLNEIWNEAPLLTAMRSLGSQNKAFGQVIDIRNVGRRLKEATSVQ